MIPAPLAGLVRALRSLWAIELLLLLHRDAGNRWHAADLVNELRSSESLVEDLLARLLEMGFVARDAEGRYGYAAAAPARDALVAELARLHAERPLAIAQAIHGGTDKKLRAFSDAFRLEKD